MSNWLLINPYELLGVTINSSLNEVRKAYYNLALYCHPDKGGIVTDMIVVCKAYKYVKEQIKLNVSEEKMNMEVLEKEFSEFCKSQEMKSPTFGEIYKETNTENFLAKFNEKFITEEKKEDISYIDPFIENGYGQYMENQEKETEYKVNECISRDPIKHEFKNELIIYKEPCNTPTSFTHQPLNVKKIDDYSHKCGGLQMFDYMKSYSRELQPDIELKEQSYDDVVKERRNFDNFIKTRGDIDISTLESSFNMIDKNKKN